MFDPNGDLLPSRDFRAWMLDPWHPVAMLAATAAIAAAAIGALLGG